MSEVSATAAPAAPARAAQRGWARLFGYDVFISFALGSSPRGCRAYASDLARRLRERGFTVFFSEDEAPVGAKLDDTLRRALRSSRILVVVANRGTLAEPRWVRTEVEEYRRVRPRGNVVPISVDGALLDPALAKNTQAWMPFAGRIWVDETAEACETGRVTDETLQRLVTAPHAVRSLVRLRIAVGFALAVFAVLAAFATLKRSEAVQERDRARQALLTSSSRHAQLLARDGRAHEGWNGLVQALAQAQPHVDGPLPEGFLEAALTTLVEDRRGPDLVFDSRAPLPPRRDDGDAEPPPWAFNARGTQVAVAWGLQLAVWSTVDGRRQAQVTLPFAVERLTFAGGGALVVAEGVARVPAGKEERAPRAAAVDVANGTVRALPLVLCEQWVPCIASEGAVTRLLPLAELPKSGLPAARHGYLATAAGATRLEGLSGDHLVLLSRWATGANRTWWLLDRSSGRALQLKIGLRASKGDGATDYGLAREAPVLVASSEFDPAIMIYHIEAGSAGPRLVKPRHLRAREAGGTKGVHMNAKGTILRYQNNRYGTGTGVGLGRTVALDVASGLELWARGWGKVAWGEPLVALQEYEAETQLLEADTGATWFIAPGRPLGFDPTGQILLVWDEAETVTSPWPRVRLLEALRVRQFSRDEESPASNRSGCVPLSQMRFLTLAERPDRLWNSDNWNRVARVGIEGEAESAVPLAAANSTAGTTRVERVSLEAHGRRWRLQAEDQRKNRTLDQAQVLHQFPQLAALLRRGENLEARLTTSADGRWSAVVTALGAEGAICEGWARWHLHRAKEPAAVRSGCTAGDPPGPDFLPAVQFLLPDAQVGGPLLAIVPVDTCRYELLEPEHGKMRGAVVPVFGNNVIVDRLAPDLLGVRSTDWYARTTAYQLQRFDSTFPEIVFMVAERNNDEESDDGAASKMERPETTSDVRPLLKAETMPDADGASLTIGFTPDGRSLSIPEKGLTTMIYVPPWGERLRERLRQAVHAQQGKAAPASAGRLDRGFAK